MLKFIIRLDDACPNMNKEKWDRVEKILDKHNIKPIVGIIPDNKDKEFKNPYIKNFWKDYAKSWQEKKWIIAQHGLNHNLSDEIRTEFSGKSYEEQYKILSSGNKILKENGIKTKCFFAPNHTFDNNTIKACNELKCFSFISDGYAFYPYKKKNMVFIPSVFDTPHKLFNFGIYTFVYHPNNMKEQDFEYLDKFLNQYKENFDINIDDIIEKYKNRIRKPHDYILQFMIFFYRKVRRKSE